MTDLKETVSQRRAVEDYLYREAQLLDERQFDAWLDLFTEDGHYWLPSTDSNDPADGVSYAYDDHATLTWRVWRLAEPSTYSQSPPSRTVRVVSNVIVTETADLLVANSAFVLHEARWSEGTEVNTFAGRNEHQLRRDADGSLKIVRKKITLVNFDQAQPNINFLW